MCAKKDNECKRGTERIMRGVDLESFREIIVSEDWNVGRMKIVWRKSVRVW